MSGALASAARGEGWESVRSLTWMVRSGAIGLDPFVEMMGGTQTKQQRHGGGAKRLASAPAQRQDRVRAASRRVTSAGAAQMRGNTGGRRGSQGDGTAGPEDERSGSAGRLRPLRQVQCAKDRRPQRPGSATPTMETYTRELFGDSADSMGAWTPRVDQIDELNCSSTKTGARTPLRTSATTNHTFTQNVGLVKPMESGIDLGAPDAHSLSLLRTHELEMERVMGTIEVLRRTRDDERAAKKEAQAEAKRLRTEMATMAKGRDGDTREEDKLRRRVTQLEKQLDLTKSKYSTSCERARELSNGLADSQRDRRELEKVCRRTEDMLRRSETERAELTAQLREATQARHSLANRLEKVVPAYAAAKEHWGQQKRELVRHVEHYRKASLRSHSANVMNTQLEQELEEHPRCVQADGEQGDVESSEESIRQDVADETQRQQHSPQKPTDVVADYAMTKEPNYQLMSYVNELVLENQQLKQLVTEQRGSAMTVEPDTDTSQDATAIVVTCTAGTQTQSTMVDLTVAVCNSETETASADASLLLEQLQQQLEEQLVCEKVTAELQRAEGVAAKEVEIHSVVSEVVASVTHEALTESAARCAVYEGATNTIAALNKEELPATDEEDPYTSPDEEYEDSSEEEQERSAEGVADYYGQLLSIDNTCASPGQNNAPIVAPTPPAGGKAQQQDTPGHGPGCLQSPPVSVPRAPAIGRIGDLQQKQLGVTGSSTGVLV
eukprot:COSAG02_NODE_1630_length_11576_cov_21.066045_6_plen_726_part_00